MGKIQVGQKSKKTVNMGGFTVVPDVVAEVETVNVSAEKLERETEGSWNFADDETGDSVCEPGEAKVEADVSEAKEASTVDDGKLEDKEDVPLERPSVADKPSIKGVKSKKNKNA